jgi:hypothetical protein
MLNDVLMVLCWLSFAISEYVRESTNKSVRSILRFGMAARGRYVELNIATPMCSAKLCVYANLLFGLALERCRLGPIATTHNYSA